jgi:hypothetical protein
VKAAEVAPFAAAGLGAESAAVVDVAAAVDPAALAGGDLAVAAVAADAPAATVALAVAAAPAAFAPLGSAAAQLTEGAGERARGWKGEVEVRERRARLKGVSWV